MLSTKLQFIWLSGFLEEDLNVKSQGQLKTDDGRQVVGKARIGFRLGELKMLQIQENIRHPFWQL
jgi:hypothetical protein